MFRIILAALLLAASPALADGCGRPTEIRFAPGTSAASLSGGVLRGELACYALTARAGQQLEAVLSRSYDNAVMQIYLPGWRISPDGGPDGTTLPGVGEGQDASRFAGPLPANGRYLIVVGAIRGNNQFTLGVTVR